MQYFRRKLKMSQESRFSVQPEGSEERANVVQRWSIVDLNLALMALLIAIAAAAVAWGVLQERRAAELAALVAQRDTSTARVQEELLAARQECARVGAQLDRAVGGPAVRVAHHVRQRLVHAQRDLAARAGIEPAGAGKILDRLARRRKVSRVGGDVQPNARRRGGRDSRRRVAVKLRHHAGH